MRQTSKQPSLLASASSLAASSAEQSLSIALQPLPQLVSWQPSLQAAASRAKAIAEQPAGRALQHREQHDFQQPLLYLFCSVCAMVPAECALCWVQRFLQEPQGWASAAGVMQSAAHEH